jgi:ABC-type multidrug transport system fused ATPase/permease subunit
MCLLTFTWLLMPAIAPYFLGRAIDAGITSGDLRGAALWAGALLLTFVVGGSAGVIQHTTIVSSWLVALYGTVDLVVHKTIQLGHLLTRRTPTGEVLSVSSSDSDTFGAVLETGTRMVASLMAFVVVVVLVLRTSPTLGLVVLLAAPVLVGAGVPLLRPLHQARALERTRTSDLTSRATDIVAGLRILRGIGGERTFGDAYAVQSQRARHAGVLTGTWQAGTEALSVLISGGLLVLLTWLGSHELLAGRLTVGQMVSFFGYAAFLVIPIRTFFYGAQRLVDGLVSAEKTIALLGQPSPWRPGVAAYVAGDIVDEVSGVIAKHGELTAVVSAVPDDSAAVADRIGRFLPGAAESADADERELKGRAARKARAERRAQVARIAADEAGIAAGRWGVTIGGVDLGDLPLADVRRHVLVSDPSAMVFQGTLREAVDPWGGATREQAEAALRTAAAEDVYDALPGGWQGQVDEKGRGLSGGQRQRVVLARALVADPDVLVLVEPTSAVDAHTEARIAGRLADHRRGRTTVVTTVSPLLLHHADTVVLLVDGTAAALGSHRELLATSSDYRAVVARGMEAAELAGVPGATEDR